MNRNLRHLLLASTAATVIGYAGNASAQSWTTMAGTGAVAMRGELSAWTTQLLAGAGQQVVATSNINGAVAAATDAILVTALTAGNNFGAAAIGNQATIAMDLGLATTADTTLVAYPIGGVAAGPAEASMLSVLGQFINSPASVQAVGLNGSVLAANTATGTITGNVISSGDTIAVAATGNLGTNTIEGTPAAALGASPLASGLLEFNALAASGTPVFTGDSSLLVSTRQATNVLHSATANAVDITAQAGTGAASLSAATAAVIDGTIQATVRGNDAANSIVLSGTAPGSLEASAGVWNMQQTNNDAAFTAQIGTSRIQVTTGDTGLAAGARAQVLDSSISVAATVSRAVNEIVGSPSISADGANIALVAPSIDPVTRVINVTADFAMLNLQDTLIPTGALSSTLNDAVLRVAPGAGASLLGASLAEVRGNALSATGTVNDATNRIVLTASGLDTPSVGIASLQMLNRVASPLVTGLQAGVTNSRIEVAGAGALTLGGASIASVDTNTVAASLTGNRATNVLALSADGAVAAGGALALSGVQDIQIGATGSLRAFVDNVDLAVAGTGAALTLTSGTAAVANNAVSATLAGNVATNQLSLASPLTGQQVADLTSVQNIASVAGATFTAEALETTLQVGSGTAADLVVAPGSTATVSNNRLMAMVDGNVATNTAFVTAPTPGAGATVTMGGTQTTTTLAALARVGDGAAGGNAPSLNVVGTGAAGGGGNYLVSGNEVTATAALNRQTNQVVLDSARLSTPVVTATSTQTVTGGSSTASVLAEGGTVLNASATQAGAVSAGRVLVANNTVAAAASGNVSGALLFSGGTATGQMTLGTTQTLTGGAIVQANVTGTGNLASASVAGLGATAATSLIASGNTIRAGATGNAASSVISGGGSFSRLR